MEKYIIRKYNISDLEKATEIWNKVVRDGVAFPQEKEMSLTEAENFFKSQIYTGVAEDQESGKIEGLYILHPNNVGRCDHIANASYAVSSFCRGNHIGEALVRDSIKKAGENGFKILQFNAVVRSNSPARHLYEKIGFKQLGVIPGGFRMKDGHYEDICPYYIETT